VEAPAPASLRACCWDVLLVWACSVEQLLPWCCPFSVAGAAPLDLASADVPVLVMLMCICRRCTCARCVWGCTDGERVEDTSPLYGSIFISTRPWKCLHTSKSGCERANLIARANVLGLGCKPLRLGEVFAEQGLAGNGDAFCRGVPVFFRHVATPLDLFFARLIRMKFG